jgi:phosphatidate cytidylyltransferase
MTTLTKRILLTVFGVPLFLSSIFFFPQQNFLLFSIVAIGFSVLGSYEMSSLLNKSSGTKVLLHPLIVGIIPFSAYLELYLIDFEYLVEISYLIFGFLILSIEVFKGSSHKFSRSISTIAHSFLHLIYPSALTLFAIRMTAFPQASMLFIFFFLMIFANDVFAYVFGMLFGKSSRGIVAVSPNKSTIGFLGGLAMSLLFAYLLHLVSPALQQTAQLWRFLLLAAIVAAAADIGDLAESVLKRSSQIKDSGTIIPGRGGILDTIDSIVFSVPIFFYASILLLKVQL